MSYLKIKNYQLFFEEQDGEGPGVLMLSSSGLGPRQWRGLKGLIPERLSYALSYLHYSPSDLWKDRSEPDIVIDFLAAEKLLDLLVKKEGGPIDVAGHSYGGFLALSLAKKYPDKIRRMALFEPIAWGVLKFDSQDDFLRTEFQKLMNRFFYQGFLGDDWLRIFLDFWNHEGFWSSLSSSKKDYWRVLYPKIYAEVKEVCFDEKRLSYWATLKHPIRILRGKSGPRSQHEVCKILSSGLENSELIETVGGHMAPITHSKEVSPLFASWF